VTPPPTDAQVIAETILGIAGMLRSSEALVKKLSGWKRIGIVASVLWAIGGYVWGASSVVTPQTFLLTCWEIAKEHPSLPENCAAEWQRYLKTYPDETRMYGLIYALVPIPFGWIIFGSLLGAGRWIRRGFAS